MPLIKDVLRPAKLHSRSLAVRRNGTCDLEIAHTRVTQSPDSDNAQRNLEIAQILRLSITSMLGSVTITHATQRNLALMICCCLIALAM